MHSPWLKIFTAWCISNRNFNFTSWWQNQYDRHCYNTKPVESELVFLSVRHALMNASSISYTSIVFWIAPIHLQRGLTHSTASIPPAHTITMLAATPKAYTRPCGRMHAPGVGGGLALACLSVCYQHLPLVPTYRGIEAEWSMKMTLFSQGASHNWRAIKPGAHFFHTLRREFEMTQSVGKAITAPVLSSLAETLIDYSIH